MSKNIVIIVGRFHEEETKIMCEVAKQTAKERGLNVVEEIWVPGSLEKPLVLQRAFKRDDVDGAAIVGIIERGQTKNGLVMGQSVLKSFIDLQLKYDKPIGIGIIGPEALDEHIEPRVKPYAAKAANAVADMLLD